MIKSKYIPAIFAALLFLNQCGTGTTTAPETTGPEFHKWAPTPPMGWNSWDCFGPTVVEDEVKSNTDYIHGKGLKFGIHLMRGSNLPDNDAFTLSLITNEGALEVNQHSINNKQLFRENDMIAWTADDPSTGDKYLALFNASDLSGAAEISVRFDQLDLKGSYVVTDLWTGNQVGKFKEVFTRKINRHGAGLYRIHK